MTDNDFKAGEEKGLVLGELKLIRQEMSAIKDSFMEFKAGIGSRVEKIEGMENSCRLNLTTEISNIKQDHKVLIEKVDDFSRAKNWVIGIVMTAFITALVALVIKK